MTASSLLGQLYTRLQALFVAHGATLQAAQSSALKVINLMVQRQSYVLAIQDAFSFTVVVIVLAIITETAVVTAEVSLICRWIDVCVSVIAITRPIYKIRYVRTIIITISISVARRRASRVTVSKTSDAVCLACYAISKTAIGTLGRRNAVPNCSRLRG